MLNIPSRSFLKNNPLVTSRLEIRPIDMADSSELWVAIDGSRAHLQRWLPWVPYNDSEEASTRFTSASVADWDSGRALRFIIRDRTERQMLGLLGFDNCVHLHRSCELGYWLTLEACGFGYMTEAADACLHFAFQRAGVHRVRCAAATTNYPSLAVITRLGFHFEGIARQAEFVDSRWLDHAVFSRLSTDEQLPQS
jgi:ribosomal-protein-serine acetyltransferase